MTEVERIQQRIVLVQAEQCQAEKNWQRCDGALQVLRAMLGDAMRQEDAPPVGTLTGRMNGELPAPGTAEA